MIIKVFKDYSALSATCAADLIEHIASVTNPVVCTASGDSPKGMYKALALKVNTNNINISHWNFLSLDEWLGMNGNDEGSCRFHLNNDLFTPMHVKENKIIFFDGSSKDPVSECKRMETFINEHGGIDVAVVGLGLNGHIGMNEPGTDINSRSHVAEIDSITQQVGQKYFKKAQSLTKGITLGIANLMEAKYVFLIVSGTKKASIVQQVLENEITNQLPASLLRNHKNFTVYLDNEAAAFLKK